MNLPCTGRVDLVSSAVNKQYGDSFFNQGLGQIWVATMSHFLVPILPSGWKGERHKYISMHHGVIYL